MTGRDAGWGRGLRPHPIGTGQAYVVALAALGLDAAASAWAAAALPGRGLVWVWRPWLALRLIHNPGAMLGMAAGHPIALTVITAAAVVLLALLVARWPHGRLGLALMLGGAAGNLASRLATGAAVVDFLQVRWWPGIFNPADVFLRTGAVLLLFTALAGGRGQR